MTVEETYAVTWCVVEYFEKSGAIRSRLGLPRNVQCLIAFGCDLNSITDAGDIALMTCAKYKQEKCLKVLAMAGANFGLVNTAGHGASSVAEPNRDARAEILRCRGPEAHVSKVEEIHGEFISIDSPIKKLVLKPQLFLVFATI
ncbi:hypothetical protein K1719_008755 [Acacia pycnantha]|nr:hypothetical protein K1719_008755 [Acacia pycnantha]